MAVDHATGEVLARVAGADYFDERRAGQVDMTQAVRSPGSTLKPFIYGLAFEDGLIHPETLIEDRPIRYGNYAPENFDLTFQGTVSVRKALQMSLNVPAVTLLDAVARQPADRAHHRCRRALRAAERRGAGPRDGARRRRRLAHRPDHALWRARARRQHHRAHRAARRASRRRRSAACSIRSPPGMSATCMIGTPPPENAAGGRIAFKTGTSYGYRDAWSVGFDGKRTIGVWVGRPDGAPVPGLVGRAAAAPILFDAFARTRRPAGAAAEGAEGRDHRRQQPAAAAAAALPPGALAERQREPAPRIMFPPNGALGSPPKAVRDGAEDLRRGASR